MYWVNPSLRCAPSNIAFLFFLPLSSASSSSQTWRTDTPRLHSRDGEKLPALWCSKRFALTWYRALTWYSSSARPFAAADHPQLVTGQQGRPSPACQQLSKARNVCAGGSSEGSTKLKHGTKLGRTLAICTIHTIWKLPPRGREKTPAL